MRDFAVVWQIGKKRVRLAIAAVNWAFHAPVKLQMYLSVFLLRISCLRMFTAQTSTKMYKVIRIRKIAEPLIGMRRCGIGDVS